MSQQEIDSMVSRIIGQDAEMLGPDSGLGNTPGWDSFAQLNLMLELESRFGIVITDDTIRKYSALSAIHALANGGSTDD